jgi:hypothetical protein
MRSLYWLACVGLVAAANTAAAQTQGNAAQGASAGQTRNATPAQTAKNRQREAAIQVKKGMDLVHANHPEEARIFLSEALAIYPTPNILWNLAVAEHDSNHPLESLGHFREWLATSKSTDKAELADANEFVAKLKAVTGHFTVSGIDANAITMDGTPLGQAVHDGPTYDVMPGRHEFKATIAQDERVQVKDIDAGTTIAVTFSPPSVAAGFTPVPSFTEVPSSVTRDRGTTSEPRHGISTRVWVTAGLGVASAALFTSAVVLGAKSTSAAHDAASAREGMPAGSCPPQGCPAIADSIHSANTNHTLSIAFGIGGLAAAGGAVLSWVFIHDKKENLTAAPLLAPGVVGAQWATHF